MNNANKIVKPYYGRLKAANETFLKTLGVSNFTVEFFFVSFIPTWGRVAATSLFSLKHRADNIE
jgi:hypothetical protein